MSSGSTKKLPTFEEYKDQCRIKIQQDLVSVSDIMNMLETAYWLGNLQTCAKDITNEPF